MKSEVQTKSKSKASKIVSIISMVLVVLCAGILVYSTISFTKNGIVKFFSYSFHVIQTESMEPDIKVGDLVIVKSVPYSEINVGDDILFKCEDTTSAVYGRYIVHRVIEIIDAENGIYKTRGINNVAPDKVPSKAEGKAVVVSSSMGAVFSFLTNWRGVIIVIAIIGLVIFTIMQVCSVVVNASKLKSEKDKQKLENNAELKEQLKQELLAEMQQEQSGEIDTGEQKAESEQENAEAQDGAQSEENAESENAEKEQSEESITEEKENEDK